MCPVNEKKKHEIRWLAGEGEKCECSKTASAMYNTEWKHEKKTLFNEWKKGTTLRQRAIEQSDNNQNDNRNSECEISSISSSKAFQSSSSELFSLRRNGNNRRMSKNRNRNAIKRVSQKKQLFDEAHLMSFAIVSRRSRILFLEHRFHSGISICKSSLS